MHEVFVENVWIPPQILTHVGSVLWPTYLKAGRTEGLGTGAIIEEDTPALIRQNIETWMSGYKDLVFAVDKQQIQADNIEVATFSSSDPNLGAYSELGYIMIVNNLNYDTGDTPITTGQVELTLSTEVEGVYKLFLFSKVAPYVGGYATVEAV